MGLGGGGLQMGGCEAGDNRRATGEGEEEGQEIKEGRGNTGSASGSAAIVHCKYGACPKFNLIDSCTRGYSRYHRRHNNCSTLMPCLCAFPNIQGCTDQVLLLLLSMPQHVWAKPFATD